jgi:3-oxoacyl-[acyl-carrier-protein] synthase II
MNKRIVVTGMGVVSSIGIGKDAFWRNLIAGKSGISRVTAFDTTEHFTHNGGEIKDFKPEEFVHKKRVQFMSRASLLGIAATRLALKDAKLDEKEIRNLTSAVCMGTTSGESTEIEHMDHSWVKKGGHHDIKKLSVIRYPENNIPSDIAFEFKFKGYNVIFTTACAAGNYAIGYGYDLLSLGKVDIVIAGGADAFSYISFTGFNQLGAVAPEKCQPFDKNRKGMIPGEGAGILILETLDHARKRKAPIAAEILGYGLSCDAFHMTNPQAEGVARCMNNALINSRTKPEDINYICAHGTGTRFNDRSESQAIRAVFGANHIQVPVSSVKSMLGHTMGAASAIEAIACCMAVNNDIIPPTINHETPDPECDIDCVPNVARKAKINIALNNGFAFGGNNSCLVIRKFY